MTFDLKAHLKTLVEAHAPSGHETAVRDLLRDAWSSVVDEFQQDKLGSLIGIKRATKPTNPPRKIMLAAHMDEIGMMVGGIVDGFIKLHNIGGMDNRLLIAQTVRVHGKRPLSGIVVAPPMELVKAKDAGRYPTLQELVVDVGLPHDQVIDLVQPGDLITVDAPLIDLNGTRVAGKALDDRACVAAVTACLHELQRLNHQWDVYAAATVQEEVGLNGARTAANLIAPDIAIALDVTFAPQPGVDQDSTCEMGSGPGIGIGPNFHPKLYDKIRETAKRHEIKLQDDVIPGASGTDAWAIQVALGGIPTALLEIPLRNMHSANETADLRDIERLGRVLALFIADLDGDFMAAIEWEMPKPAEASA
ncbi:MAG: M20/M25/M40 family metallo-hydrolase [bacterium]|nr:M20/M25/M40 family metallo-hydrolase [bacterium]